MKSKWLGYLGYWIYRVLVATWRVTVIESPSFKRALDEKSTFVMGHWHGDELGILFLLRRYHVVCMISKSDDGSIMTTVAELLGAQVVRGSSSRGATSGLKGLIRSTRAGRRPSLAVDGPKGPRHQVKPGVFELSKLLSLPVFPVSVAANRAWHFEKSWNKAFLPKPFAKVVVFWGEPLPAPGKEADPRSPDLALGLAQALHNAKNHARKHLEG